MSVQTTSYEWAFSYEELIKLKKMDPWQAELYKSKKLKAYNEARIGRAIQAAREYYAVHVTKDPNWQSKYAAELRESILNIPWIDKSEEHIDIYRQAKSQTEQLDVLAWSINQEIWQPWMEDLWADEPEVTPAPVEEAPVEESEDKTEEIVEEDNSEAEEIEKDKIEEAPVEEEIKEKKPKRKITFKNKK